jgi:hypothetical protein
MLNSNNLNSHIILAASHASPVSNNLKLVRQSTKEEFSTTDESSSRRDGRLNFHFQSGKKNKKSTTEEHIAKLE